jgi:hypothetical protein
MKHASDSMFSRVKTPRRTVPAFASCVTLSAALVFSGTAVAENCNSLSGSMDHLIALPILACPAEINPIACFLGNFRGDLAGQSVSGLTSLQPVPGHSGTIIFTARSTIQLPDGTISTADVGIGTGCTPMGPPCTSSNEVLTITSGTGAYEKAYGTIFVTGKYLSEDTTAGGAYQGQICTGKTKRNRD